MFPSEATQATQYGPGVRAVAAYLNSYQLLPLARIVELFGDLFGHRPSESMILNASKRSTRRSDRRWTRSSRS